MSKTNPMSWLLFNASWYWKKNKGITHRFCAIDLQHERRKNAKPTTAWQRLQSFLEQQSHQRTIGKKLAAWQRILIHRPKKSRDMRNTLNRLHGLTLWRQKRLTARSKSRSSRAAVNVGGGRDEGAIARTHKIRGSGWSWLHLRPLKIPVNISSRL